jgi:hypothetical protein
MRGPKGAQIGTLKRLLISNLVASNNFAPFSSIVSGIPNAEIEDVSIRNVFVEHQGGGTGEMAALKLAENEKDYPEHMMFGSVIPAQGFYLRHIRNLEMSDIEIRSKSQDLRPAFIVDNVNGADFWHVKANLSAGVSMFALTNVNDFAVSRSKPVEDARMGHIAETTLS